MYYKTNLISYTHLKKINKELKPTLIDNIIIKKDENGFKEIVSNKYIAVIKQSKITKDNEFFILEESLTNENLANAKEVEDYQMLFNMNLHPIISLMFLNDVKSKQKEYVDDTPIVTIEKIKKITYKKEKDM